MKDQGHLTVAQVIGIFHAERPPELHINVEGRRCVVEPNREPWTVNTDVRGLTLAELLLRSDTVNPQGGVCWPVEDTLIKFRKREKT